MHEHDAGTVELLHRYPVKSVLGEEQETLTVHARGVAGDRAWAVFDTGTGKVASAKRPKLWRELLQCSAVTTQDGVRIVLPDGTVCRAGEASLDRALSALTGRSVRLIDTPPEAAQIDRAFPEVALARGLDADVEYSILVLGGGAPPGTFLDYAALHLITSATLAGISELVSGDPIEIPRYRPNVVIRSPAGAAGFVENAWLDAVVRIGADVALRVILQT
ncbi:MAG: MOSC N-terminal beta barrel domain-containing protein, partial [Acetobacteraceae bacterium]